MPFWLYDFDAETEMTAKAEKIRTERHGDTEYTYTDHFHVYRDVEAQFEKVPADASEKMDDDTMDKLEPFDYTALNRLQCRISQDIFQNGIISPMSRCRAVSEKG